MFLAFFIDQIQLSSCQKFKQVMGKMIRKSYAWKRFESQICQLFFESWEQFYGLIVGDFKVKAELINTS
jgi:hypothetical protein